MIKRLKWILVGLLLVVLVGIIVGSHFITDYMWFTNLGYANLLTTRLVWEWGLRLGAWLGFTLVLAINLFIMRPVFKQALLHFSNSDHGLEKKHLTWGTVLLSLVWV